MRKDQAMTTAERYERNYCLALLRTANAVLQELQNPGYVKLAPAKGPAKMQMVKRNGKRQRQDKSALGRV